MIDQTHTLLLSHGFEPLRLIPWRRAIRLLTLGKVEVIEQYDWDIRTVSLVIKAPAVVRLLRSIRRHKGQVRFSRANIYARDAWTCQYCGTKPPGEELTYDHVVPRAQGGTTTWTNIVTCCFTCNRAKGNRTPEQAGVKLLSVPIQPRWVPAVVIQISTRSIPDAWRDYLYWTGILDS
jgi:5-methylcytosine-specific restriction endonuclease McrA